jgi:type II secretory pathway pseudopilin PulG
MRRCGLRSARSKITNYQSQIPQRGYMMITLMLALALITIALLGVLPDIKQQIRRDREEELIHRGTAYMRAIQHFNRKFGRYPSRVEELENSNNLRFLRKHYTDPVNRDPATGKEREFKLLHQQDVTLNNGPVLGPTTGQIGGGGTGGVAGSQMQSGFGGTQGGLGGMQNGLGGAQGGLGSPTGGLQQTASSTPASGDAGNGASGNSSEGNSAGSASSSNSGSGFNGQTFGGGPILGVASLSKEKTIRVFFDKNHYKDWLFIYMPMADRAGLLTGPVNPNMPTGNVPGLNPNPTTPAPGPSQPQGQPIGLTPNGESPNPPPAQPPPDSEQTPPQQ